MFRKLFYAPQGLNGFSAPQGPSDFHPSQGLNRFPAAQASRVFRASRRFRAPRGLRLLSSVVIFAAMASVSAPSEALSSSPGVHVVVLREGGIGSAANAQSYLDRMLSVAARLNGWPSVTGAFHTDRARAQAYVATEKPQFGIFTLGAYLGLRGELGLKAIGRANARGGGGGQYFVVSRSVTALEGCEGKTLATTVADDPAFVDRVVLAGAAKLADFTVVPMKRPLQPIKAIARDEVVCALIDDAQLTELEKNPEAAGVRSLWASAQLPPMVVAALPTASAKEAEAFRESLPKVCVEGKTECDAVGMDSLDRVDPAAFDKLVSAYEG